MTSSDDITLIQIADMLQELIASGQVVDVTKYERFTLGELVSCDGDILTSITGVTFTLYIYPPENDDVK